MVSCFLFRDFKVISVFGGRDPAVGILLDANCQPFSATRWLATQSVVPLCFSIFVGGRRPLISGEPTFYALNDDPQDRRCGTLRDRSRSPSRPLHRPILPVVSGQPGQHPSTSGCAGRVMRQLVLTSPVGYVGLDSFAGAGFWRALVGRERSQVSVLGGPQALVTSDASAGVVHADRTIRRLVGQHLAFYIGITQNPHRRWEHHSRSIGWCRMIVVVEAPSAATTVIIEQSLLQRWLQHPCCRNVGGGGESPTAGRPHYVYVLEGTGTGLTRSR